MLHGVWLEGGRARYRNRWVLTSSLRAEMAAGRALFGGMMTPALVDMKLLGPDPDPGWPIKLDAFINIVRHAGSWLALPEGLPPYEVTAELETVGRYTVGGALPDGMCAHPKADPATGELVVFRYDVEAPFLAGRSSAPTARSLGRRPPSTASTRAVHDPRLRHHAPRGWCWSSPRPHRPGGHGAPAGDVLRWEPERGTQVALIDRSGDRARPLDRARPVLRVALRQRLRASGGRARWRRHRGLPVVEPVRRSVAAQLIRCGVASPGCASIRRRVPDGSTRLDGVGSEFPRIDDRLTGQAHRYVTVSRKSGRRDDLITGEFDQLARHDLQTGHDARPSTPTPSSVRWSSPRGTAPPESSTATT